MEKQPPKLSNLIGTKAANAFNAKGFAHYFVKSYCLHTLGRQHFELHAVGATIGEEQLKTVFAESLGFPKTLNEWAKNGTAKVAAGLVPTENERVTDEDLQDFGLLHLVANPQIDWAEIWRELFEQ